MNRNIRFLRGTATGIKNNANEKLAPGQPLYNVTDKFLTVGANEGDTVSNLHPIATNEVHGYWDGKVASESNTPEYDYRIGPDASKKNLELTTKNGYVVVKGTHLHLNDSSDPSDGAPIDFGTGDSTGSYGARIGYQDKILTLDADGSAGTDHILNIKALGGIKLNNTEIFNKDGNLLTNAATATKFNSAKKITLTGDVTGSASASGENGWSIITTVQDDSHNHIISNIDGLQTALNGKAPTNHASSGTTYGVATASNYGHAKASTTTPKVDGTASVGDETYSFARGDHVHPTDTSRAASDHTHTASIQSTTSSSGTQLASNTMYTITTGGSSFNFKTPIDNNTTYKLKQGDIFGCLNFEVIGGPTTSVAVKGFDASGNLDLSGKQISASTFVATSDKRLKENITPYMSEKSILDLPVYKYNFISDENKKIHVGCLAQDLQEICPEIVNIDEKGYLSIEESKIVYLLLEEVKQLREKLEKLSNRR